MKIAIIGSGIAGLSAAYSLHNKHDVTLFEKDHRAGGHARTISLNILGRSDVVDTGFIVFNDRNYPLLRRFFDHLAIPYEKSDMSFGVSIDNGRVEYSSNNVFAQPLNLFKPQFWRMIGDILRFNAKATDWISREDLTLGEMLREFKGSPWFNDYYIKPMGAAIWSCSTRTIEDFPAAAFLRFFANHGLLTIFKQPQWFTVSGGSKVYVDKIVAKLGENVKLNCGVAKVFGGERPSLMDTSGARHEFDRIILACHPDQALEMLYNPTENQSRVLSGFRYQKNKIVVHADTSLMPKRKAAWASWVYLSDQDGHLCLSYWMNNLQNKDKAASIIETLNPPKRPAAHLIYDEYEFAHPVFTAQALASQELLDSIQGQGNLYFCGAWCKNGFHEDGIASAVHVLDLMRETVLWR